MRIIGDIHGKIDAYKTIISDCNASINVGDVGFKDEYEMLLEINSSMSKIFHKTLQGNHDYYIERERYEYVVLGDYGYLEEYDIFFIRGANSIDKHHRIEGVDWFREEELSYSLVNDICDLYEETKPSIVISHDCPYSIKDYVCKFLDKTVTNNILECVYQCEHKPSKWLFGHYHKSFKKVINNVEFICLNELEYIDL